MGVLKPHAKPRQFAAIGALLIVSAALGAQDTTRAAPPPVQAPSRISARLLVVFRPPARGVRRERALTRGNNGARAILPSPAIDSFVPQTLRSSPFVAVCIGGEPDSARLIVRVGEVRSAVMIALKPGLNRIALEPAHMPLSDGDVAEWSLATRSGEVFLQEFIHRQVVASTPTIASLTRNGIWYDALDLFVLDALRGIPLARERLDTFLRDVGTTRCADAITPP
jgi:hypothetical protein